MALTHAEIAKCQDALVRAVQFDIGVELAEYYGAAVFFGKNQKPEQPNNEIRNAINHFARAFEANDWAEAEEDIRKACGHIERAKRDSLKLAAIGLFEEIRDLLLSIEVHYGFLDLAIAMKKSELKEERRRIYMLESSGHKDMNVMFLKLFADSRDFLTGIQNRFPGIRAQSTRRLVVMKWKRHISISMISFSIGAVSGVFANYIWSHISKYFGI